MYTTGLLMDIYIYLLSLEESDTLPETNELHLKMDGF